MNFIETLGPLAWQKFESRYPEIKFRGQQPKMEDRSAMPPYTSFRFENEDPEVINRLRFAVETYSGEIEWVMEGHSREMFPGTTNWVIYPKRTSESRKIALDAGMVVGQYMALNDPEFGPITYIPESGPLSRLLLGEQCAFRSCQNDSHD
ncbi:hypothetical protein [Cupriavidus basilensis]|uniref:Uncharacterized protein n=1 Tax=Cupriavidus basilensis TaxID=68895 RepID=A0A643FQI0_9BURK|nr:hypothetical protein [Cupriavidus basilensis]QOT79040.1 hypothetical protein F7R26_030170 [Cupriavidus basilensis]